jgi:hypothetical protein
MTWITALVAILVFLMLTPKVRSAPPAAAVPSVLVSALPPTPNSLDVPGGDHPDFNSIQILCKYK